MYFFINVQYITIKIIKRCLLFNHSFISFYFFTHSKY